MSARRFSLDTNVLVYFYDARDLAKQAAAQQLVAEAAARDCMLGLQAVGEFFSVVTRKGILTHADGGREALNYLMTFPSFAASLEAHRVAAREASAGRLSYWDAVLLRSADEAGCTVILSEDKRDGLRLGGITVRNPFGRTGLSAAASAALAP